VKITRAEKVDKEFQKAYQDLLREGLKPNNALKEARKLVKVSGWTI